MNNFRLSDKKIYQDERSSIENLHNKKMEDILEKYDSLEKKKEEFLFIKEKIKILELKNKDSFVINTLNDYKSKYNDLEKEIKDIETGHELSDYISRAWDFLSDFKDNTYESEENHVKSCNKSNNDNKSNDNKSSNILDYINNKGKTSKGYEYKKYYEKCVLNINEPELNKETNNRICKDCKNNEFDIDYRNALIICINCGLCEPYIDTGINSINYDDTSHLQPVTQPFSYQRKNHFKEWLNQLQGKEVTVIPDSVVNLVLLEIKKERITNSEDITSDRIKKYLKKLKLNKYYEHIPNLINLITNKPPLTISNEFEEVLLELFDKIQEPFKKYCPTNRKNFLSYSYTLHKFCQLLGKTEYLVYFPLLKSREKLYEQEKIWKDICFELNWNFIPSV